MRSRTNASPSLERNVERFTQYLTLVGLTALLVGGVGVANAVKGHLDRRRDRHRHAQGGGRDRRARVRDLSDPGDGARRPRRAAGPRHRRGVAVSHRLGLRRRAAVADRAGAASRRACAGAPLRAAHRRRLRVVAARARPRRAGLGAVPRRGRQRSTLAAPALHRGDGRCWAARSRCSRSRSPTTGASPRSSWRLRPRYSCCCAWSRRSDADRAPPAASALAVRSARALPTSIGRARSRRASCCRSAWGSRSWSP